MTNSSQNSCLPPPLLEKCLDLSKEFAQKKNGQFKLEIKLGTSNYFCSIDHSTSKQTGSASQFEKKKKKSPSDQRRSALRREKFLENKRNENLHPVASSPKPPSSDLSKVSFISETPMTTDTIEAMATDCSDQATLQEPTLVINDARNSANEVPEMSQPMNYVINKVPVINRTGEHKEETNEKMIDEPPPLISPISSPSPKNKNPPLNYEVHLLICASDQVAASKKIDKKLNYLGPHPRNHNHFRFSTHHDEKTINNLKNPQTLNFMSKSFGIQSIRMVSENKNYLPDKQFHCQDCRNKHIKK